MDRVPDSAVQTPQSPEDARRDRVAAIFAFIRKTWECPNADVAVYHLLFDLAMYCDDNGIDLAANIRQVADDYEALGYARPAAPGPLDAFRTVDYDRARKTRPRR